VDSVGSVELLLRLRATGPRPQDVEELCAALESPRKWTLLQLDSLARAGLIEHAEGRWRYAPRSAELAAAVDDLAEAWRRDSSVVSRWVFRPARTSRRRGTA
jgi:DNA-binding IclR family transcriptional regulator